MRRIKGRFLVPCMVAAAGCAADGPATSPGMTLQFAALSTAGCQETGSGRNTIPDTVATLAVAVQAGTAAPRVERISRDALNKKGQWLISDVVAGEPVAVSVWGCDASKAVTWTGRTIGLTVEAQKETSTQVFLAPTRSLGCTGSEARNAGAGETDHLQKGRSLAVGVALPSGDAAIVGGIGSWSGQTKSGVASRDIEVFDHAVGVFRKGPQLLAGRAWHHAFALDATRILVVGGVTGVDQFGSTKLPTPILTPAKPDGALPAIAAELVDLAAGTSKASAAAVGAGAQLLSSATMWNGGLLFVGGVDSSQVPTTTANILTDLGAVADGGAGTAKSLTLQVARARPGLVTLSNGAVLVWGGNLNGKAADAAEWIQSTDKGFVRLTVAGDAALLAADPLATIDPIVVSLGASAGVETLLVSGGIPAGSPSAAQSKTFAARVDLASGAITLVAIDSGSTTLFGGIAGLGVAREGVALLSPGAIALLGGAPCAAGGSECIGGAVWQVRVSGEATASPLKLEVQALDALGGPRFGIASVQVPTGTLLVGGQSTLVDTKVEGEAALDPTARLVGHVPTDPAFGALCP